MVVCAVAGETCQSGGAVHHRIQVLRAGLGGGGGLAVVTLAEPLAWVRVWGGKGRSAGPEEPREEGPRRRGDIPIVKVEKD